MTSSNFAEVPSTSFLTIPREIRLTIYELLLVNSDTKTMNIRTEDPPEYESRKHQERLRSRYHRIMSDQSRERSMETTYRLNHNPGIFSSILGVNRQTHAESAYVLYSEHIFDFNGDLESVVPFLGDLTPCALSSIKRINIIQRAKDFDRCGWRNACQFISSKMGLVQLGLGISGENPTAQWEAEVVIEKSDFKDISNFGEWEWVQQVAAIKGLQVLDVKAHLQHCPPPETNKAAFFANFSASIETGFAEYLREQMVAPAA